MAGAVVFVSETRGKVTGVYAGLMQRFYLATDIFMASNLLWYVTEEDRSGWGLLKAFEEWASGKDGQVILRVGFTDGIGDPERFNKAMTRKGWRVSGALFEKELSNGS